MGLNVEILEIFTILFGKIGLKIKEILKADYELPLKDDYLFDRTAQLQKRPGCFF